MSDRIVYQLQDLKKSYGMREVLKGIRQESAPPGALNAEHLYKMNEAPRSVLRVSLESLWETWVWLGQSMHQVWEICFGSECSRSQESTTRGQVRTLEGTVLDLLLPMPEKVRC